MIRLVVLAAAVVLLVAGTKHAWSHPDQRCPYPQHAAYDPIHRHWTCGHVIHRAPVAPRRAHRDRS